MSRSFVLTCCLLHVSGVVVAGEGENTAEPPASPPVLRSQLAGSRVVYANLEGALSAHEADTRGTRHYVHIATQTEKRDDKPVTVYFLEHVTQALQGEETTTRSASWTSVDEYPETWTPLDTRVTTNDECLTIADHETPRPKQATLRELVLLREGRLERVLRTTTTASSARLLLDAHDQPLVFIHGGGAISLWHGGNEQLITSDVDQDWSVAEDTTGRLYVVTYNRESRSLSVKTSIDADGPWQTLALDQRESGWQHSIAMCGDELLVFYYFYRNAFNKGLRLAGITRGELTFNTTFRRERDFNIGWEPLLGARPDGSLRVTYLENVDQQRRTTHDFPSPQAMLVNHPEEVTGRWEDNARLVEVDAGTRVAYQSWLVGSPDPDAKDTPVRYSPTYVYDPGLVTTYYAGARVGSVQLGAEYARNELADRIGTAAGQAARRVYQVFAGHVGIDKVFEGQDVRVSVSRARFRGVYRDLEGSRSANTNLNAFELALLSPRRVKYGLQGRSYNLTEPIYGYFAPANQKSYSFVGASVVDARIYRLELFVGYSRLDYLTKYETSYFGFVYDFSLAVGAGVSTFPNINLGGHDLGSDVTLAMSSGLRLGLAYYKRFYDLRGAGLQISAGYETWGLTHGMSTSKPSDRDDKTDKDKENLAKDDFTSLTAHHQFFHGPYVSVGLVY